MRDSMLGMLHGKLRGVSHSRGLPRRICSLRHRPGDDGRQFESLPPPCGRKRTVIPQTDVEMIPVRSQCSTRATVVARNLKQSTSAPVIERPSLGLVSEVTALHPRRVARPPGTSYEHSLPRAVPVDDSNSITTNSLESKASSRRPDISSHLPGNFHPLHDCVILPIHATPCFPEVVLLSHFGNGSCLVRV